MSFRSGAPPLAAAPAVLALLLLDACGAAPEPPGQAGAALAGEPTADAVVTTPPRQLLVAEQLSPACWAAARQVGAGGCWFFYEQDIDADHDGEPDLDRLGRRLTDMPADYRGFACLDWENTVVDSLKQSPGSPPFQRALASMRAALRLARQVRPQARWGYYGLPVREYWNRDAHWRARGLALAPLIAAADAVYPSVYDFYRDADGSAERDHAYVRDNVKLALEVAGDKPVYACIMRRYHPAGRQASTTLIPPAELAAHVRAVFEAEHRGRRAAGVVWWGVETWQAANSGAPLAEMRPDETLQQCLDRLNLETLRVLTDVLGEPRAVSGSP